MVSVSEILVVEDERTMADVVERYLQRDGHQVRIVRDGAEVLAAVERSRPDLILLDLMLPGIDGMEVCRRVRAISAIPIIMMTARGEEVDRLLGFSLGADDYVTKPFSPRELAARVQAVLRRSQASTPAGDLHFGALHLSDRNRAVELTAREFDLLYLLASHPRQVFSREQLLDRLWDVDSFAEPSTVTVHIRRIREKVEADPARPRHVKTVWGVGYKFEP
jgi:DNA-binding response OmpR family regulator